MHPIKLTSTIVLIISFGLIETINAQSRGRVKFNGGIESTSSDYVRSTNRQTKLFATENVTPKLEISNRIRSSNTSTVAPNRSRRINNLRTTRNSQPSTVTVASVRRRTTTSDVDEFLDVAPSNRVETQENAIVVEKRPIYQSSTAKNVPSIPNKLSSRYISRSTTRARSLQFQGRSRNLGKMNGTFTTNSAFSSRYGKSGFTGTPTSEKGNTGDDTTTAKVKINYALLRSSVRKQNKNPVVKAQKNNIDDENYPAEFKERFKSKSLVDETSTVRYESSASSKPEEEMTTEEPKPARRKVVKLRKVLRTSTTQAPTTEEIVRPTYRSHLKKITTASAEPSVTTTTEISKKNFYARPRPTKLRTLTEATTNEIPVTVTDVPKQNNRKRAKPTTPVYTATIPVFITPKSFVNRRRAKNNEEVLLEAAESGDTQVTSNENSLGYSDFVVNDLDIIPIQSGQMQNQLSVETSNHSPSVTVSIFNALSDIFSQSTESLDSLSNEPSTSTPTTTTTTTTTAATTTSATTPFPSFSSDPDFYVKVSDNKTSNTYDNKTFNQTEYYSLVNNVNRTGKRVNIAGILPELVVGAAAPVRDGFENNTIINESVNIPMQSLQLLPDTTVSPALLTTDSQMSDTFAFSQSYTTTQSPFKLFAPGSKVNGTDYDLIASETTTDASTTNSISTSTDDFSETTTKMPITYFGYLPFPVDFRTISPDKVEIEITGGYSTIAGAVLKNETTRISGEKTVNIYPVLEKNDTTTDVVANLLNTLSVSTQTLSATLEAILGNDSLVEEPKNSSDLVNLMTNSTLNQLTKLFPEFDNETFSTTDSFIETTADYIDSSEDITTSFPESIPTHPSPVSSTKERVIIVTPATFIAEDVDETTFATTVQAQTSPNFVTDDDEDSTSSTIFTSLEVTETTTVEATTAFTTSIPKVSRPPSTLTTTERQKLENFTKINVKFLTATKTPPTTKVLGKTTETVDEKYVPRFLNRIPIQPIGWMPSSNMASIPTTKTTVQAAVLVSTTTPKQREIGEPVKKKPHVPEKKPATKRTTLDDIVFVSTTETPQEDYVVYGILANNTVVKRIMHGKSIKVTESVVYGILPNNTVVLKYPNGTVVQDKTMNKVEITDIDPRQLLNPYSEFNRNKANFQLSNNNNNHNNNSPNNLNNTTMTNVAAATVKPTLKTFTDPVSSSTSRPMNSTNLLNILQKIQNDFPLKSDNVFSLTSTTKKFKNTTPSMANEVVKNVIERTTAKQIDITDATTEQETTTLSTTTTERSTTAKPSTTTKRSTTAKPSTTTERSTTAKPSTTTERSTTAKPSTTTDRSTTTVEMTTRETSTASEPDLVIVTSELPETKTESSTINILTFFDDDSNLNEISSNQDVITRFQSQNPVKNSNLQIGSSTISLNEANSIEVSQKPKTTKSSNNANLSILQNIFYNQFLTTTTLSTSKMPTTPIETTTIAATTTSTLPPTTTEVKTTTTTRRSTTPSTTMRIMTTTTYRPVTRPTTTRSPSTTVQITTTSTARPVTTRMITTVNSPSTRSFQQQVKVERATTQRPRTTTVSDAEDFAFLAQLARFLNGGGRATTPSPKPKTTRRTTTQTTTTPTTTTTTTTLAATTTTTPRPTTTVQSTERTSIPTVLTNKDDYDFLNNLRQYAKLITPKNTTPLPLYFPNRFDDLSINRTGKSVDNRITLEDIQSIIASQENQDIDPIELINLLNKRKAQRAALTTPTTTTTTTTSKPKLSTIEIERTRIALQREEAAYNQNLNLLSTLLGRPISPDEVGKLAQQITKPVAPAFRPLPATTRPTTTSTQRTTTTLRTTTMPIATTKSRSADELEQLQFIQNILRSQQTTTLAPNFYGKSNDAVLAALLKQQGLSPVNNNLPLDELIETAINSQNTLQSPIPATRRPFVPPLPIPQQPQRSGRPLLDGLSWLWQQWQESSPTPRRVPTANAFTGNNPALFNQNRIRSPVVAVPDDGLDADAPQQTIPLDPPQTGFGIGASLLNAAIGVTRSVTSFLGLALQGAAKTFQGALAGPASGSGAAGPSPADANYYRFSG